LNYVFPTLGLKSQPINTIQVGSSPPVDLSKKKKKKIGNKTATSSAGSSFEFEAIYRIPS
jgi:hypothetical protein